MKKILSIILVLVNTSCKMNKDNVKTISEEQLKDNADLLSNLLKDKLKTCIINKKT